MQKVLPLTQTSNVNPKLINLGFNLKYLSIFDVSNKWLMLKR